jgi:phosphatidyl-myo-inositol dimannoside synthase
MLETRSLVVYAPRYIALMASEVCTRGGIQSFMLRVAEVIGGLVEENLASSGICFSLNDSTEALRQHPAMPSAIKVWGASLSKIKLIIHTLKGKPIVNVFFVGHVHMSPLAFILKALGKIDSYYVILHGIEAWHRVSFLQRRALLGARGIIATTRYTAEECAKHNGIPLDRFHIIPLCADERSVIPSAGFKLKGAFKLLCVARQDASERYKGFEQLFHALVLLKASHPDIHLNLVGKGNDQVRLKNLTYELGIAEQVTFWGALSDEDLAASYADCDVFAMPSKKEGFGIVFLEAMRLGKPCIGGNHGGTPEVIEHGKNGFLVEYVDVSALAECIRVLADDASLRRKMGKYGQQLVSNKFSLQSFQLAYKTKFLEE